METYFDFAVDRFRRPQSTWVNRSLRLAFKVVLNFLEAHRATDHYYRCSMHAMLSPNSFMNGVT